MTTTMSAERVRLLSRLLDQKKIVPEAPPIPRRDSGRKDLPLSFAQQRIWFVHQLQPTSTLYNSAGTARLRGRLDVDVLRRCMAEIVRRHEVLRTTYRLAGGRPVQHIGSAPAVPLPLTDLTGRPPGERAAAARACQKRLMNQPFDLERDMPLRGELLRLAPDEHWLVLAMHHIAGDGWSLGVIQHEMAALYTAYLHGRPSPLPELSLQYADFALWQRGWFSGEVERCELGYWREKLEGAALLDLPTVRPRQADGDWGGSAVVFDLPPGLVRSLTSVGDSERATLYMVLLAAVTVVFSRWSGQRDVVIGSPIANRNRLDLEALIGCFVNTLPLRLDTSRNPAFRSLLRQAREVCLEAYAHQDAPFERIVEAVNPERAAGGQAPLIRHMLGLDNAPRPVLNLPDLDVEFDVFRPEKARFDIEWVLNPLRDGGIGGRVWYATELFDESSITRLLASLRTVLTAAAADPGMSIGQMPILAESERVRLLERFSGASATAPQATQPLRELIGQRMAASPDEVAFADSSRRWTYGELLRWADGELAAAADRAPQGAQLLAYSAWMRETLGFRPGDAALFLGPLTRQAALPEPLAVLFLGGRAVVPDAARSADPCYVAGLIAAERPSVVTCTPSQLAALFADGHANGLTPRHLLLGGEPPWPGLLAECQRVLPEATVWSVCRSGGLPVAADRLAPGAPGAPGARLAGRPIAGAVLYVLDQHTELVPIGVAGELYVAGSVLAPALESVPNPYRPGESLLRTGERARWRSDGVLEMLGPVSQVRDTLLSHHMVDRAEVVAGQAGQTPCGSEKDVPRSGLVAYFSLRREAVPRRHLRAMFEERYAGRSVEDDPALNPATWTSPSTGIQVTADDLRDWSDTTVRRSLALRPSRMLEIGCRNGLLLLRLAPQCEHYCATDLSARALAHIRESKDWVVGRAGAIQLLRQAPDDFGSLEPDRFDLVLLSSLVQYSPGLEYLEQTITGAARVVRPGGTILISDVRSLPLLPALHVSATCRSAPGTPLAELRQLIADRIDGEAELTVDPAWFAGTAAGLPGIAGATVLARSGRPGELTGYRYDVLLRVGECDAEPVRWLDLAGVDLAASQLDDLLTGISPGPAGIRDVPDGRVRVAARAAELLADSQAADVAGLWDAAAAEMSAAITFAELRAVAARAGYDTVLAGPAASAVPGLLDVVMSRAPATGAAASVPVLGPARPGPLGHANDVVHAARAKAAAPLLQGHLRERLPAHMIPELVLRRTWPVGRSGVLEPDRLPRPRQPESQAAVQRLPQTETEQAVARIWADVLGVDQVGAEDDFFALGGHSLMAAEITDRIRTELGLDLPLSQLFEEPSVASVASYLENVAREATPTPAIRRIDRAAYRRATVATGSD